MVDRDGIVDLLVLGGGTAGLVGAMTAADVGARTVLVERDRTGGDWRGPAVSRPRHSLPPPPRPAQGQCSPGRPRTFPSCAP
ncbi:MULTISPECIES: FAD-dependent oxidoreductase [unclassified Arthrobacter]|uniref:FAD-dependent oxidoreductase n=1 Tax=unclassified Arthrobacter TaxID=235627 RepID=UPI003393AFAB